MPSGTDNWPLTYIKNRAPGADLASALPGRESQAGGLDRYTSASAKAVGAVLFWPASDARVPH